MKMSDKIFVKNNLKLLPKDSPFNIGLDVKAISIDIVGSKYKSYYRHIDYIEYDTGISLDSLKRNSEEQVYTLVYPRSSISKKNLLLCNSVGLIDPNYRDTIKLRFKYICQPCDFITYANNDLLVNINEEKIYSIGDKIGQLVFMKTIPTKIEYVPELMSSDRTGGFGSTGE
jgi:dUTPase